MNSKQRDEALGVLHRYRQGNAGLAEDALAELRAILVTEQSMTYPRVRKLYTPAEINEAVAALQQNTEVGLNEAQAMSMIKSLFALGFRILNTGKIENEFARVREIKAGPQDRKPVNGQQR